MRADILDFYRSQDAMTGLGDHAAAVLALPSDLPAVAHTVQGLLLHEHWAPAYGQTLSDARRSETHTRLAAAMLDLALAHDPKPLGEARALEDRVIGTCRNFTVLAVAILRAHGVPARARCGFASYFEPGKMVDHWVVEAWDGVRWVQADTQLDALQASRIHPDFEPLETPRDRFVIAGEAWRQCRAGEADASAFGIMHMTGLWFIGGNVVRDAASLAGVPMLPWDCWGAMPGPDGVVTADQGAFLDRLAELTIDPDAHFDELQRLYRDDDRLRRPGQVLNAVRGQVEAV